MNICSCCFRRYTEKGKPQWYGWFDGSYPPEAKVLGSKWYHEQIATSLIEPDERVEELEQQMEDLSLQADAVEAEEEAQAHIETKEEKKEALKARIKELQVAAKPGKMSLKDIQAAFKEITNLKTQIHML
jgi:chromosome segregation ATPase